MAMFSLNTKELHKLQKSNFIIARKKKLIYVKIHLLNSINLII